MSNSRANVSAVIVTWNSARTLRLCLDSLYKQDGVNLEIILVDNASNDLTLEIAQEFPEIVIFHNERNMGFCYSNNLGISKAHGDFVLLINPDACLTSGYLSTLLPIMEGNPQIAAISGKLLRLSPDGNPLTMDGKFIIDSAGIQLKRTRQAVDIGRGQPDTDQFDCECYVFGLCAAVVLYRRQALIEAAVDGEIFDEIYFAYYEDVDLAWRLGLLGWKCLFTPTATAFHVRGWRENRSNRKNIDEVIRYHSYKNKHLTLLKNERFWTLLPDILFFLGYELVAIGYILLKEPFLIRTYIEIRRNFSHIRNWRQVIHRRTSAWDINVNLTNFPRPRM